MYLVLYFSSRAEHCATDLSICTFSLGAEISKMKPRVSIVNGIARMKKYNTEQLGAHYNDMGYEVVEHKFPTHLLFCCHMHHKLEPIVENMVEGADIIHCQSSGFFPVLPHFVKHNIRKPLIMESPVLKSHTGTLLAATNKVSWRIRQL